ncbi:MAG: A/G-specific adenine glycosylase, partial [Pirellulales bacterium]
ESTTEQPNPCGRLSSPTLMVQFVAAGEGLHRSREPISVTQKSNSESVALARFDVGATYPPTAAWKREFRRRLLAWFGEHARELPWRRSRDPYRVWVSEIMLQQTQVATVEPYFRRFIRLFPSLRALAAAPEEQVLLAWEGLGYYRRARQLHRAARMIVEQHRGRFPHDPAAVRALPGIGRYTAGAITSIAFDAREAIVEANTVRLFSRLLAYAGDTGQAAAQRLFWEFAEQLLPAGEAGRFNQALMELGSLVCLPREPQCGRCPVVTLCPTHRGGLQQVIPRVATRRPATSVREAALIVRRRRRVLLVRRDQAPRWAGLWDFPRFELGERCGDAPHGLAEQLLSLTGIVARPAGLLATLKHSVTRFRITLDCHLADYVSSGRPPEGTELKWTRPGELESYPLSATGRRLSRLLD